MEILSWIALIMAVISLAFALYRAFWRQPDNNDLIQEIEDIWAYVQELETKQKVDFTELWDYIESKIEPLNKRLATRLMREKQKDLNQEEPLKRSGLITPQEALRRKHGVT